MTSNMLQAALDWLTVGAALVPLQPGSKYQVRGFGAKLKQIAGADAARYWFGQRRCNLAVVCAGRLACLDFDDQVSYFTWGDGVNTLTEKTRRGHHCFVWSDVARSVRVSDTFEIKAGGAVVTVSPSVVAGVTYQVVKALPIKSMDLSAFLPDLSLNSEIKKHSSGKEGADILAKCKQYLDILDVAQELQAARGRPALRSRDGNKWRGLCPFHDDKRPSYYVDVQAGYFKCSACGVWGDVLNLYQSLRGLDSVGAAVKELARRVS